VQGNDSAAVLPQRNVLSDDTLHTFLGTESVHLHLKKKNLRTCCVHADTSSFYRPDSFVRFHFVQHRGNCACSRPRTESSCCDNETRRRASDLFAPVGCLRLSAVQCSNRPFRRTCIGANRTLSPLGGRRRGPRSVRNDLSRPGEWWRRVDTVPPGRSPSRSPPPELVGGRGRGSKAVWSRRILF